MTRYRRKITALACAAVLATGSMFIAGCASGGNGAGASGSETTVNLGNSGSSNMLSDFTVSDPEGNEVSLSSKQGKPTVVCFWTTTCVNSSESAKVLRSLDEKYGDQINIMLVDASNGSKDEQDEAGRWLYAHSCKFPYYYDTNGSAASSVNIKELPTIWVLNSNGTIAGSLSAAGSADDASAVIDASLNS